MFYIDDYNSKVITNSPPKKEDRIELAKAKIDMVGKQLAVFWHVAGVSIADNYNQVKELLSKYGYQVNNEEDSASAIADMLGTPKWTKFVKEFGDIIENTIDERILKNFKGTGEESSWVEALVQAVGSVAGSSLNLTSSSKQIIIATKENAKSQMLTGIESTMAEKERTEAEIKKTDEDGKDKKTVWMIVIAVIVIVIIGIVIYRKRKAQIPA